MPLDDLLTEQANPGSAHVDELGTGEILALINTEDQKVAAAVGHALPEIALATDAIYGRVRLDGRLFYIGAGTSGRLGVLDAAECPPTFSVSPDLVRGIIAGGEPALAHATEATEDSPASGREDVLASGFGSKDALVGIAASGRTPYVLGAIAEARALGAVTVGLSCTPQSELSRLAEIAIEVLVGPEVIAGSTRMKAGTATKMVLNMISTTLMIRLGHVFGNLMVNVQPKNAKLERRAERIIEQSLHVSRERASALLAESGRSVKTAILMGRRGCSRAEAESRLLETGGHLSEALRV